MENKLDNHTIVAYAEQQLAEHIAELKTQYEGREMPSNDEKKEAFEKHCKMFRAELEEKFKELGYEEKGQDIIKEYIEKYNKALPSK